jgi:hypothetical protein
MKCPSLFRILLFILLSNFIISCNDIDETSQNIANEDSEEILNLRKELMDRDSSLVSLVKVLNDIEDNLMAIKEKEGIITLSKGNEFYSDDEQILNDLYFISSLMDKNKARINELNNQLKKSNLKNSEIEKLVQRLTLQVQEKDSQITDLKADLIRLNNSYEKLFSEYNQRIYELDAKTDQINMGFYVFGTAKELSKNGVISKEGGFVGIGGVKKLLENFNKDYFTQTDISLLNEIPLHSKKAKLITNHPPSSYSFAGNNGASEKLLIIDPKEFWSVSRYLVIIVE